MTGLVRARITTSPGVVLADPYLTDVDSIRSDPIVQNERHWASSGGYRSQVRGRLCGLGLITGSPRDLSAFTFRGCIDARSRRELFSHHDACRAKHSKEGWGTEALSLNVWNGHGEKLGPLHHEGNHACRSETRRELSFAYITTLDDHTWNVTICSRP